MVTPDDVDAIEDIVWQIVGLPAWHVRLGYASFVTMEFGARRSAPDEHPRGEWHLWIYLCDWRLRIYGKEVAHCRGDRATLTEVVQRLEGRTLESFVIDPDLVTTELHFSDDAVMTVSPARHRRDDSWEPWMLFLPDGRVLSLFADGQWKLTPGDELP